MPTELSAQRFAAFSIASRFGLNSAPGVTPSAVTFDELGLLPTILGAVRAAGYETPTPIQVPAIPPVRDGRDVLGVALFQTAREYDFVPSLFDGSP